VLAILTVTDRPVGVGSLVEVVLCHPQKAAVNITRLTDYERRWM